MEAIPQILTFLGLVFMIFLIITTFKLSSTIAELRGRVISLEETLDSKNKEIRHKRTYIDEMQAKLLRLEYYHSMYQAPAPEIKAYKSVRLMSEIEKGSIEADISDQELEGIEEVEYQHFVNRSDGGGRCGNRSRGFVKFITDKGAACELYVCKMHYKVLTEKLEKNKNVYNSEIR